MSYVERAILISWSPGAFFRRDSPRSSRLRVAFYNRGAFPKLLRDGVLLPRRVPRARQLSRDYLRVIQRTLRYRASHSPKWRVAAILRGPNDEDYSDERSFSRSTARARLELLRITRRRVGKRKRSVVKEIYVIEMSSDICSRKRKYLCKKDHWYLSRV